MSRPTRSLRPSLDPLEAKTLLSSGAVGHAAGHPRRGSQGPSSRILPTSTCRPRDFGHKCHLGPYRKWGLCQSGTVGNLGGPPPVRVYTTKAAANTLPSLFTFTYNVGDSKTPSYTDTGRAPLDRVWHAS